MKFILLILYVIDAKLNQLLKILMLFFLYLTFNASHTPLCSKQKHQVGMVINAGSDLFHPAHRFNHRSTSMLKTE